MHRLATVAGLLTGLVTAWWLTAEGARGEEPSSPVVAGLEMPAAIVEPARPPSLAPGHEALSAPVLGSDEGKEGTERIPKPPPPPVPERPGAGPNRPGAQWVGGYWAWDKVRRDFVWVTGTWRVSPPGRFWVNGYWRRDGRGWYRVSGFWSARDDRDEGPRTDWRKDGPPRSPEEDAGPAPDPDSFYVAGVYAPDPEGGDLVWKSGFWFHAQPGWEWIPARWVHRSSGWTFHEGSWQRVEGPREAAAPQPTPRPFFPPGYPSSPYYMPRYGYGPGQGSLRGRVGAFINQIVP